MSIFQLHPTGPSDRSQPSTKIDGGKLNQNPIWIRTVCSARLNPVIRGLPAKSAKWLSCAKLKPWWILVNTIRCYFAQEAREIIPVVWHVLACWALCHTGRTEITCNENAHRSLSGNNSRSVFTANTVIQANQRWLCLERIWKVVLETMPILTEEILIFCTVSESI